MSKVIAVRVISLLLLLPLSLLPGGCGRGGAEKMAYQVEMDVYSGVPNPVWNLSAAEAEEFLGRFRALAPRAGAQRRAEALGYRGMIVKPVGERIEGWEEITVGFGSIAAREGVTAKYFTDPGRALEKWLLQSAKGQVKEDLYNYVLAEVSRD
jgi:hypothetical protein